MKKVFVRSLRDKTSLVVASVYACDGWRKPPNERRNADRACPQIQQFSCRKITALLGLPPLAEWTCSALIGPHLESHTSCSKTNPCRRNPGTRKLLPRQTAVPRDCP